MPTPKEFCCGLNIIHAIFSNTAILAILEKTAEIKSRDAVTLRTFNAETLAEKIEAELSDCSVKRKLLQEIAVLA